MKRKARWFALLVLVLVTGAGGWYWTSSTGRVEADKPLLATVDFNNIENTIASAGKLKPSRYVDVGAQVSGQLQKLHVEVGDKVETGQLLAEIDARVQESKVEASRANIAAQVAQLDARKAALALAKANAERQERLMADNASSQLEYDNAVNNLAAAESSLIQLEKQIEQGRASLASEETQLEYTKIYAPAEGTVVSIEMNEGRTLNASQQAPTILRIADLSLMTVEADISEADIGNIKKGMPVYFTTLGSGTRRWYGNLRQVLPTPTVTNNVVLYTGLFDADNTDGSLFSEMTAQVYFVTASAQNVLTVPLAALKFQEFNPADIAARIAGRQQGGNAADTAGSPGSAAGVAGGPRPPAGAFPGGGQRPPGGFPGGQGRGAGGFAGQGGGANAAGQPARRPATVTVVKADGSQETREVMVGVTTRVAAEIISGLQQGEQVIAGILQSEPSGAAGAPPGDPRRAFRMMGGF